MILTKQLFVVIMYIFEKVDSCLVLTEVYDEEHIPTQLRGSILCSLSEKVLGDGFCDNGARVVLKYCFHHYNIS